MKPNYKKPFNSFIKKAIKALQLAIEDVVLEICQSPEIGEEKAGDLKGVFVYKFRFNRQEYLIAYKYAVSEDVVSLLWIDFYQVGSHENFYEELKRYLRNRP
jgi:mRNA-degrading endonuclease RelE of RelBE toxin-antitoxin system